YNELYKKALPGALNLLLVETDGLPNSVVYNWWNGNSYGISATSNCLDSNGLTRAAGGWASAGSGRQWSSGQSMNTGGTGYMADVPAGAVGVVATSDPPGQSFTVLRNPVQAGHSGNNNSVSITTAAPGCKFSGGTSGSMSDFAWLPATDVYGNSVYPSTAY